MDLHPEAQLLRGAKPPFRKKVPPFRKNFLQRCLRLTSPRRKSCPNPAKRVTVKVTLHLTPLIKIVIPGGNRMSDDLIDDEIALLCAIGECDSSKLPAIRN